MHSLPDDLLTPFQHIGRDMFVTGLTTSHGGNMSVRQGERILIKRSGAQLGRLTGDVLVWVCVTEGADDDPRASSDLIVHRAVYKATSAQAVIHAHLRTATALSLSREVISPIDVTGPLMVGDVPVIDTVYPATPAVADVIGQALQGQPIVMLRGHGCVSTGESLEDAYKRLAVLEEVSDIILRAHLISLGISSPL
ncbi:MAG: fuculose phosphate aldolase [Chloroflexi bacterium]|nr:fuculose phosphate aldolase [Chloroflexota bacterium]